MTRIAALPLLLLLVALAGCGEKAEPTGAGPGGTEPFTVMLDYFPNADHAGLYGAQASGDYREGGLDVKLQAPPDAAAPLKLLQAGRVDLAISYEPELLLARDKGADLVAVGALVQQPLTSLMSLGAKPITRPESLADKRVGTSGLGYQSAYLRTILEKAGVDPGTVKETNVGFKLTQAMLSGQVDATLGAFWNYEGVDLERRGRKPTILRMDDLGVPTYNELIFVARRSDLDREGGSRIRRFMQATARGHQQLAERPDLALDALLKADPGLDRGLENAVVKATLRSFFPADDERPFGYQDPTEWAAYETWMRENDLLTQPPGDRPPLTNEFLPGQGVDPGTSGLE